MTASISEFPISLRYSRHSSEMRSDGTADAMIEADFDVPIFGPSNVAHDATFHWILGQSYRPKKR
jgi:hypothetical protein